MGRKMKNIKQLKKLLEDIKHKNYLLSEYSFSDYDIEKVISNNLTRHRDNIFNDLNSMQLKSDRADNFKIYKDDGEKAFKDFAEIETEIKKHFSSRTKADTQEELLKEVSLNFELNGESWDIRKKPFNEIKAILEREHKKELVFYNYFSEYITTRETSERVNKIVELFNIVLKKNISIKFNELDYKEPLDNIADHINKSQDTFKVRLFLNHKLKIRFSDDADFKKIRTLLMNQEFKRYTKEVYFLSDSLTDAEIKELSKMQIAENGEKSFLYISMNEETLKAWKVKKPNVKFILDMDREQQDIKYIYSFYKNDKYREDSIKKMVAESRLSSYALNQTINLVNTFFEGVQNDR